MERIRVLIARLKEQAEQKASPSQMLVTVQMLQNEFIPAPGKWQFWLWAPQRLP